MQLGRVAARSPPAESYLGLQIAGLSFLREDNWETVPVNSRGPCGAAGSACCGRHAPDAGCFFHNIHL